MGDCDMAQMSSSL